VADERARFLNVLLGLLDDFMNQGEKVEGQGILTMQDRTSTD
jgi:hypothetical protein